MKPSKHDIRFAEDYIRSNNYHSGYCNYDGKDEYKYCWGTEMGCYSLVHLLAKFRQAGRTGGKVEE